MSKTQDILEANEYASKFSNNGVSREDTFKYIREVYNLNSREINQILDNYSFGGSGTKIPDNTLPRKEDCVHISTRNSAENPKNQEKNNSAKRILYTLLGICALTGVFLIGKAFNSNNQSRITQQQTREYSQKNQPIEQSSQQGYVSQTMQEQSPPKIEQKNLETIVGMNEWASSQAGFSFRVDSVRTRRISVHAAVFPNEEPSESSGINSWYDIFVIYASIKGNSDKITSVIPSDFALRADGKSYWTMLNFDKEYAQRIMNYVCASRSTKEVSQYSSISYILPFIRSAAFDAPYASDMTPLPQTILRLGHFSDGYKTQVEVGNPY